VDLKDFVRETLVQIATGVKDAQDDVRRLGGVVNPAANSPAPGNGYFTSLQDGHHVFLVDFDVAITASENTATNAGVKLSVATLLNLGAGGQSGNAIAATNRLSFKVPLAYPVDGQTHAKLAEDNRHLREAATRSLDYPGGFTV
jgi:hypothetical protein